MERISHAPREMKRPETAKAGAAREMTKREVATLATTLFQKSLNEGTLTNEQVSQWAEKKLHGVKYKNTNVLTVDWDTVYEPQMDKPLKHLVQSPGVSNVVAEYFSPDLAIHAKAVPIAGYFWEKTINEPIKNEKSLHRRPTYSSQYKRRLHFAKELTDAAAEGKKSVLCMDIANKPLYMGLRDFAVFVESFLGDRSGKRIDAALKSKSMNTNGLFQEIGRKAPWYWWATKLLMQMTKTGIYNQKEISSIEKFQLHLEDARRLVVAEGVLQHVDRMPPSDKANAKTMLVVYPSAHNIRIRNYMERLSAGDIDMPLQVKDIAYRLVSDPILEFKEREYAYSNGAWQKIRSEKITRGTTSPATLTNTQVFVATGKP